MKKLTFFIGSMGKGGAERVISILANHFVDSGWAVDIIMLLKNDVQYKLSEKINLTDMVGKSTSYIKNTLDWAKGIRKYITRTKPSCIISFVARINALVLSSSIGLDVPIIVSERNDPRNDGRSRLMQYYCDHVYRKATAVVFQTDYERACFSARVQKRAYIIKNPVSIQCCRTIDWAKANAIRIVNVGRLAEQKNQKMLIDAIAILVREYPELTCEIYGEGPLRDKLEGQISLMSLQNTVFLKGNVDNLHESICDASIFVMTSNYEGLSNACIEAMMMGLPCITTQYAGAEELITNKVNGLTIRCGDTQELVEAIRTILHNPDLAEQLGRTAKESVAQYQTDRVLKEWERLIDKIGVKRK